MEFVPTNDITVVPYFYAKYTMMQCMVNNAYPKFRGAITEVICC